jgi:hypothetical protein
MNILLMIGDFFKVITNLPALINVIQVAVIAVEQTGALGADKKAAVVQAVDNFGKNVLNFDLTPFNGIIGYLIDLVVDVYNLTGFFTHKSTSK